MEPSAKISGLNAVTPAQSLPLSPLPPAIEEARTFRRFSLFQEAGVQMAADHAPHQFMDASVGWSHSFGGLCYRSVAVRDLSLIGLYFLTSLPYRPGCHVEIQLPLSTQTLHLPATVCRLVPPTPGSQGKEFGCGVDFLYSQMTPAARQGLIEFLMHRFSPASVVPNRKRANLDAWASRRPL